MENNLYQAARQWSQRPNDERFWSLQDAFQAARKHKEQSKTVPVVLNTLKCLTDGTEIILNGSTEASTLTHHGFNDLCRNIGAPANFLRTLSPELVAKNIQEKLDQTEKEGEFLLKTLENQSPKIRCFNSLDYDRIWNLNPIIKLMTLEAQGWRTPPARPAKNDPRARPATAQDVIRSSHTGGLGIKEGDMIAPAGIYVSDHDMFVFMIFDTPINDGSGKPLYRGFFFSNAEVPGAKAKMTMFLYHSVCGNHIVWNVENVMEIGIIHKGKANEKLNSELTLELSKYANASAYNTEQKIKSAQVKLIADTKEDVIDFIFGKGLLGKKETEKAYEYAVIEADVHNAGWSPNSHWGFAQGITAYSQTMPYADERVALDKVSGKVLQLAM